MDQKIPTNYFTGENKVGLEHTVQEAEVMFAANDEIKAMAEKGELQDLHERYNILNTKARFEYMTILDRLNNIIAAAQTKEDEICIEAMAANENLIL